MSSQLAEQFITPIEYLLQERQAATKSEYFNGRIYAMAGASRSHNRITLNLSAMLHSQLKGSVCEPFAGDMRVKVSSTGLYTYPDVVVVCGDPKFEEQPVDTLLNPTLIIEVLSTSTEIYDRVDKFAHYQTLESLTDYLLIAQNRPRIEHYQRQSATQWLYSSIEGVEKHVDITTINCTLSLTEIYARVVFPAVAIR